MPRASRSPHAPVLFAFALVKPSPREHRIGTARLRLSRLSHWTALVFAVAAAVVAWPARAFDFGDVIQIAGELAGRPYRPRTATIPDELRKLTFAQFQQIRYKPERNLWHRANIPFEVSFVHLGTAFAEPVTVHELSTDGTRRLVFDPEQFDYGPLKLPPLKSGELGFAGFRVHYPLNDRTRKDEVVVFLGASYFRAVAQGLRYGLAARGLAIDTGEASGEEFPRFVEFWINRPSPGDRDLIIFALLDSRRATGAVRIVLRPGAPTRMDVRARFYLRENVAKLGIAPLTSMFFYGENQPPPSPTLRPEVHDSDGLSIRSSSGEWLWRPLQNPRRLLITSFALNDPLGFGLLQRDRAFRAYEDLDARYEMRPGAWVEPKGKWGPGRVELVQIPSPDETNDNIVAYWIPAKQPAPKRPLDLEYQLTWGRDPELPRPAVRVAQTRRLQSAAAERKDKAGTEKSTLFVIDFEPDPALKLPETSVQWLVSGDDNADIVERTLRRHEATGGWRATVRVRAIDEKRPVELRGQLNADGAPLSEVWSYIVPPE
jgi:glucans biosynthesis protein